KNHNLMKKYNLISPHITFTTNSFFNPLDSEDISQFAFLLFIPTCSFDVNFVDGSEYDVTSGPFLFPDHKLGIDFDHLHGILKMIWHSNKDFHTWGIILIPPKYFCRLGMSLKINCSLTNACICYHGGIYKNAAHYWGDHCLQLFLSPGKVDASIISLFYLKKIFFGCLIFS
ncbi:hypothetical protein VP01_5981g1, partial [Puccinia sorghi]